MFAIDRALVIITVLLVSGNVRSTNASSICVPKTVEVAGVVLGVDRLNDLVYRLGSPSTIYLAGADGEGPGLPMPP